jgi:hypothetical protein
LATLVVLMGYGFRLISGTVLRFIGIAAFLLTVMGSFRELDNNDAFTWIAFLALPQGWINAAFVNGLAREQWEGWLYLAPCLPFILLAIRAVSRLCIIKEYSFSPGLIQVVMRESSLLARRSKSLEQQIEENPALRDRKGKLVRRVAANAADAADTDVALVEARIRQREFLRPLDWRAAGYVERVIGTRLSDRQRLVLEAIEWAGPWRTPNRVLTALVGIGLVILLWAMPPAGLPFLIVLLWGCWVAFSAKGDQKPQRLGRVCSVLPIGYDEPSRALFRATWWSAMLLTPLALMFGLGQALMWNAALDQTLLRVFIGIAAFPAVLPFVVAHSFATIINDKSVWIYPAWLGPVAVFMLAPMVMLIPVPIHLAVAATVTYFLSNVLLWHVYRHLYNRSKLDLLL